MFFNPGNVSNSGNGGTGGSGDGHIHSNLSTLNKVTESKLREWNNKSNFSGNYNDLTNKPTIPTVDVTKVYVDSEVSKKADKTHSHSEYATPSYVQEKIAEASLSGGEVDLSAYATKAELNTKADKSHTHNELHSHSNKAVLDGITSSKVNEWNNKSTFNGDYNSLTNKPVIPSTEGLATESYVQAKIAEASLSGGEVDLSGYATREELNSKANVSDLSSVAISGNYQDLINKPTIPTVDVTKEYVDTELSKKANISHTHKEYLTFIPDEYITEMELESKGYLTQHQDISGKVDKIDGKGLSSNDYTTEEKEKLAYLENYVHPETHEATMIVEDANRRFVSDIEKENWNNKSDFDGNYNSLSNKPIIPSIDGLATETYVNNKIIPNLVGNTVTNKTLTLTVDKYQYAVLSNGDSIVLPSVSSFTEIHLFFKASADLTVTFPSVRWQSIPSIASGHTYEIIFTYVVDEWLAGVICYE